MGPQPLYRQTFWNGLQAFFCCHDQASLTVLIMQKSAFDHAIARFVAEAEPRVRVIFDKMAVDRLIL
jgi:hypothetical protein